MRFLICWWRSRNEWFHMFMVAGFAVSFIGYLFLDAAIIGMGETGVSKGAVIGSALFSTMSFNGLVCLWGYCVSKQRERVARSARQRAAERRNRIMAGMIAEDSHSL